jgi:hypothetical protein
MVIAHAQAAAPEQSEAVTDNGDAEAAEAAKAAAHAARLRRLQLARIDVV